MCVNRFGCRPVMLVGGLFASLGMVAASFCTSIIQIYLTTGVITGESGDLQASRTAEPSRAGRAVLRRL